MTIAILFIVALPICIVLWYYFQARRVERGYHDDTRHKYVPRCEGQSHPSHCEAAALVRRTLAEMGVEVRAK